MIKTTSTTTRSARTARTALAGPVTAVLNTASGSVEPGAAARMKAIFKDAGLDHARIVEAGADDIEAAVAEAVASAGVIVVLGGDGTIRTAAGSCGRCRKLIIPLPGGTMNMLPHALYGAHPWAQVLADTLAAPMVRTVSGGRIGDQTFYCAAILGAPSLWADAREAVRHGHLIEAVKRSAVAIEHSGEPLQYRLGEGPEGQAQAVAVICPLVSSALSSDAPALEAAALDPEAATGLFSLAYHAVFDDWRNDPSVSLARVRQVDLRAPGRIPAILDGEKAHLGRRGRVTFLPRAFRALVPAKARP